MSPLRFQSADSCRKWCLCHLWAISGHSFRTRSTSKYLYEILSYRRTVPVLSSPLGLEHLSPHRVRSMLESVHLTKDLQTLISFFAVLCIKFIVALAFTLVLFNLCTYIVEGQLAPPDFAGKHSFVAVVTL